MHSALLTHIKKIVSVTAGDEQLIISAFQLVELEKKQHLFTEGQKCSSHYFISQGCLRLYFIKANGQEQITQFGIDNWWITDYMSFEQQRVSGFYLQAVEPSTVLSITHGRQDELLKQVPQLEKYFRVIMQKAYAAYQMRMRFLADLTGEEQYHHFNNAFPGFVQRIPQYMLASYLGFTPEFLSKIRSKRH